MLKLNRVLCLIQLVRGLCLIILFVSFYQKLEMTWRITKNNEVEVYTDYHFKSHSLIYSQIDLTSRMMDIFALMLTSMRESDWDNGAPEYRFNTVDLSQWFGVKPSHIYAILKEPAKEMARREVDIDTGTGFKYNPILSEIRYEKGVLSISPNPKLKSVYIVNANQLGHAKIDNTIFRSLANPNTKRVFEFLCRYRYDRDMYFIEIKKLQTMFGVFSERGDVLKKAYQRPRAFVRRVIEPALKQISESETALKKLSLQRSINGELGYGV